MKPEQYCPVVLEPELEEQASLWPVVKRFDEGRKLRRWSHQLIISTRVVKCQFEPELAALADGWTFEKRIDMAKKFKRWGRQLKVSALVMVRRRVPDHICRSLTVPTLPLRKAILN